MSVDEALVISVEFWKTHCRFCGGKLSAKGHALFKDPLGHDHRLHSVCKTAIENQVKAVCKPVTSNFKGGNPSR